MSAVEHLQLSQFHGQLYHGGSTDILDAVRPRGRGQPGSGYGAMGYRSGQRADEHAFATEREPEAWTFADASTRDNSRPNDAPTGRARVYQVAQAPDARLGRYHPDHPKQTPGNGWGRLHEHVSQVGFPVGERIDTKPGEQGTIPIDWTPYRRPGGHADVNHPTLDEVEHGHPGSSMNKRHLEDVFPMPSARPQPHPGQLELPL